FEPMDANDAEKPFEFVNEVIGGAVPKEFVAPIADGIEEAMRSGVIGGYPVLGVRAVLVDGSYHEVDSSELAFHIAGSMAFKEAMRRGDPVLLEPIMKVDVTVPEEYMGDVIGDINSRRGHIDGMEARNNAQIIRCHVPLAEMFGYATDLRSKTQGRGVYSMEVNHYEPVPKSIQDKISQGYSNE
ncbi:MAG: elongation factor G, partial [Defluviitaleaceae bacterium]|nr:elongation factor G [Defluviitaleaceae bacterium]